GWVAGWSLLLPLLRCAVGSGYQVPILRERNAIAESCPESLNAGIAQGRVTADEIVIKVVFINVERCQGVQVRGKKQGFKPSGTNLVPGDVEGGQAVNGWGGGQKYHTVLPNIWKEAPGHVVNVIHHVAAEIEFRQPDEMG